MMDAQEQTARETAAAALMAKARTQLILRQPFFGTLAMRLKYGPDWTRPTAATDGRRLIYNPDFILTLTLAATMGLIAHEICHCIFDHQGRRNGRDPKLWNIAGDFAINPMLMDAAQDLELPEGCLYDPDFDGMTVDEIYSKIKLPDPPKPPKKKPAKGKPDPNGTGTGAPGQDDPEDDPEDDQDDPEDDQDDPEDDQDDPEDDQDDPEDDPQDPQESPQDDADGKKTIVPPQDPKDAPGDVLDDPGPDPDDPQEDNTPWTSDALQARAAAKQFGTMPGRIDAALTEQIKPTYTVADIVRRFVSESLPQNSTWRRPNKKFKAHGLTLPSISSPTPGPIAVFVDCSGSIDTAQIAQAIEAAAGIAEELRTPLIVAACNTRIEYYHRFEPGEAVNVKISTGGGTDFRPPFEKIEQEGETLTAAVYISADLDGNFPEPQDAPPYPVAWISEPLERAPEIPFGEHHPVMKSSYPC